MQEEGKDLIPGQETANFDDKPVKNAEILEKIETEDVEMVAPSQRSKTKREEIAAEMDRLGFQYPPMTVLVEKARPNSQRHYLVSGYDANLGRRRYILDRTNGWQSGQKRLKLDMVTVETTMKVQEKGGKRPLTQISLDEHSQKLAEMQRAYEQRREYTRPITEADVTRKEEGAE